MSIQPIHSFAHAFNCTPFSFSFMNFVLYDMMYLLFLYFQKKNLALRCPRTPGPSLRLDIASKIMVSCAVWHEFLTYYYLLVTVVMIPLL